MENTTALLTDKQQIIQILDEVVECFRSKDLDRLLSLHTEDVIVMEPDRPAISGMDEVREVFTAAFERLKTKNIRVHLSFKILEMEVWGRRAFVRGQVVKETTLPGENAEKETGKFLCLFRKDNGEDWLRSHVMASFDAPKKNQQEEIFWDDIKFDHSTKNNSHG